MIRLTVHFAGHVQGVGFRWTTARIAGRYKVAGYVQNLPDGRVLLVAEGEPEAVQTFLEDLETQMADHIRSKTVDQGPANGEFGPPALGKLGIRH